MQLVPLTPRRCGASWARRISGRGLSRRAGGLVVSISSALYQCVVESKRDWKVGHAVTVCRVLRLLVFSWQVQGLTVCKDAAVVSSSISNVCVCVCVKNPWRQGRAGDVRAAAALARAPVAAAEEAAQEREVVRQGGVGVGVGHAVWALRVRGCHLRRRGRGREQEEEYE
jgi:hypothetical protein